MANKNSMCIVRLLSISFICRKFTYPPLKHVRKIKTSCKENKFSYIYVPEKKWIFSFLIKIDVITHASDQKV